MEKVKYSWVSYDFLFTLSQESVDLMSDSASSDDSDLSDLACDIEDELNKVATAKSPSPMKVTTKSAVKRKLAEALLSSTEEDKLPRESGASLPRRGRSSRGRGAATCASGPTSKPQVPIGSGKALDCLTEAASVPDVAAAAPSAASKGTDCSTQLAKPPQSGDPPGRFVRPPPLRQAAHAESAAAAGPATPFRGRRSSPRRAVQPASLSSSESECEGQSAAAAVSVERTGVEQSLITEHCRGQDSARSVGQNLQTEEQVGTALTPDLKIPKSCEEATVPSDRSSTFGISDSTSLKQVEENGCKKSEERSALLRKSHEEPTIDFSLQDEFILSDSDEDENGSVNEAEKDVVLIATSPSKARQPSESRSSVRDDVSSPLVTAVSITNAAESAEEPRVKADPNTENDEQHLGTLRKSPELLSVAGERDTTEPPVGDVPPLPTLTSRRATLTARGTSAALRPVRQKASAAHIDFGCAQRVTRSSMSRPRAASKADKSLASVGEAAPAARGELTSPPVAGADVATGGVCEDTPCSLQCDKQTPTIEIVDKDDSVTCRDINFSPSRCSDGPLNRSADELPSSPTLTTGEKSTSVLAEETVSAKGAEYQQETMENVRAISLESKSTDLEELCTHNVDLVEDAVQADSSCNINIGPVICTSRVSARNGDNAKSESTSNREREESLNRSDDIAKKLSTRSFTSRTIEEDAEAVDNEICSRPNSNVEGASIVEGRVAEHADNVTLLSSPHEKSVEETSVNAVGARAVETSLTSSNSSIRDGENFNRLQSITPELALSEMKDLLPELSDSSAADSPKKIMHSPQKLTTGESLCTSPRESEDSFWSISDGRKATLRSAKKRKANKSAMQAKVSNKSRSKGRKLLGNGTKSVSVNDKKARKEAHIVTELLEQPSAASCESIMTNSEQAGDCASSPPAFLAGIRELLGESQPLLSPLRELTPLPPTPPRRQPLAPSPVAFTDSVQAGAVLRPTCRSLTDCLLPQTTDEQVLPGF